MSLPKIQDTVVLGPLAPAFWQVLGEHKKRIKDLSPLVAEARGDALEKARFLVCRHRWSIDKKLLAQAPQLKAVLCASVGVDNVDLKTCQEREIRVLHEPEGNRTAAVEQTLALLLACAKRVASADAAMKAGAWTRDQHVSFELAGKVFGIIGLGQIGIRVAQAVKALGMKVVAFDPYQDDEWFDLHGVEPMESLPTLLARSQVVSLHCPLTKETRYMLNRTRLCAMNPGSILLNVARGGLIDEEFLSRQLDEDFFWAVGLDTWDHEPNYPKALAKKERVVAAPHLGSATREAKQRTAENAARTLLALWADPDDPDLPEPKWV